MKQFKKIIPVAVLALAIASAFSAHGVNRSQTTSSVQGYNQLNPQGTICEVSLICSDISGPLCVIGGTQVWGKDFSGKCVVRLYRDTFR